LLGLEHGRLAPLDIVFDFLLVVSLCNSEGFILMVVPRVDDLADFDPGVNVFGQLGKETFDLVGSLIAATPREQLE